MTVRRRFVWWGLLLLGLCVAGCGPLPHPFEHEGIAPALTTPRALIPLVVPPQEQAPGLAEAVVAALDEEDIAASIQSGESDFQTLRATVQPDRKTIHWDLLDPDGHSAFAFDMALAPSLAVDPHWHKSAQYVAVHVAQTLRADGREPVRPWPLVMVETLTVPPGFDEPGLHRALEDALIAQGCRIAADAATYRVGGEVKTTPMEGGRSLVQLRWVVKDKSGKELGVVTQSNPVDDTVLQQQLSTILHPIALGAVEGVRSLIK